MAIAYFHMENGDKRPFVIRLENDELNAHARHLMAGTMTSKSRVQGTIVSNLDDHNPGWSFHPRTRLHRVLRLRHGGVRRSFAPCRRAFGRSWWPFASRCPLVMPLGLASDRRGHRVFCTGQ